MPKEQLSLIKAIRRFGLEREFARRSNRGQYRAQLVAWLRETIGNRADVAYPADLRSTRQAFGCQCEHGGRRHPRGRKALV
mgnify:CR=1 FL=1